MRAPPTPTRRPRATSTSANTHGARSGRRCAHTALPYQEVLTWSTDGFYRETRVKVEARRREGCALVEMECAALAARAGFMGAVCGMILYTADSPAHTKRYDAHAWGEGVREYALALCLDAVLNV